MKATKAEPKFESVILTLESQHEVDAVFSLFCIPRLAEATKLNQAWSELINFRNKSNSEKIIKDIQAIVLC